MVLVYFVSLVDGSQKELGSWPRVYEQFEEKEGWGLYVRDTIGTATLLANRGAGGGWVLNNGDRTEYSAKYYTE
jgi:hypothetical protein